MLEMLKNQRLVKRLRKTRWYGRWRQCFPMSPDKVIDDGPWVEEADVVKIEWPENIKKPVFGIIQDYGGFPKWTKYRRFLKNNGFDYGIYNIHAHDWMERARDFDCIAGVSSCSAWDLQELREKFYFLEKFVGKRTFPSTHDVFLYEDKKLEAYIAKRHGIPFAATYISYDREDAFSVIERLKYPVVSKIVPGSSSEGVELVGNKEGAANIVRQAFSPRGRKSYHNSFRQKTYVYFQDFVPNDGYDIRVIAVGGYLSGFYRRVLPGDFRASGMGLEEKRALPEEAMKIALTLKSAVKSPLLVVDMVRANTGEYVVIEYSPLCQIQSPAELQVGDIPGVYTWTPANGFAFLRASFWMDELALREFLLAGLPATCLPDSHLRA